MRFFSGSATLPGAPESPSAFRAPTSDLRPGGVDRGETSSGELRLERQYRDRWRLRLAEEKGGEMESEYRLMVGIDWATEAHQVCVLNRRGRLLEQRRAEHRAEAIATMIDRLIELAGGDPASIAVAIEVPRGAVVEALVERGLHVYAINPKQLDRFRDRHTVAGAKDDRRDAFVLADSLRTDLSAFRRVQPDHPRVVELRALSRVEDDLGEDLRRLSNRLR